MQFTCCIKCSFTVNYCNKVSSRIVLISKGFSVFFWITLSHKVSRHFPHTRTPISTYANFKNLLHIHCTLADIPLHWWRIRCPVEEEEQNPGLSVADCVHTVIFQNICGNRALYDANQIQGGVPHALDLRSTTK